MFQAGDHVRCILPGCVLFDQSGTVRATYPDGDCWVHFHDSTAALCTPGTLQLVYRPGPASCIVTPPEIALALLGDDRRAPDGDVFECMMLALLTGHAS